MVAAARGGEKNKIWSPIPAPRKIKGNEEAKGGVSWGEGDWMPIEAITASIRIHSKAVCLSEKPPVLSWSIEGKVCLRLGDWVEI